MIPSSIGVPQVLRIHLAHLSCRGKGTDTGIMEMGDTGSRRMHQLMAGPPTPTTPTTTADQMHHLPTASGVANTHSSPTTVSSTPMQSREGIRDRS